MRRLLTGLVLAIVAGGPHVDASSRRQQRQELPPAVKVLPRDDSASDPSFLAFKRRLLSAARRGDVAVLRASMAPTLNAYFEQATRDQVIAAEQLREGQPWVALVEALELGVGREPDRPDLFIAPYVSATSGLDGFEDLVVLGHGVRLRQSPDPRADVVGVLSYDVVRASWDHYSFREPGEAWSLDEPRHWVHVLTSAGSSGYVFGRFVRAGADQRYYFEKVNGRWRMTALAAGD